MASRLQDVHRRGLAVDRPLPTLVAPGTLYYSTDTQITERCSDTGTAWESYSDAGAAPPALRRQITFIIDGGGVVITTGLKDFVSIPVAGTFKKWRILSIDAAVLSGSIVLDVWKAAYAGYPPVVGGTITAAAKPTIAGAIKAEDSGLAGWTLAFAAGDTFAINVDSVATFKKIALMLEYE